MVLMVTFYTGEKWFLKWNKRAILSGYKLKDIIGIIIRYRIFAVSYKQSVTDMHLYNVRKINKAWFIEEKENKWLKVLENKDILE